jgi:sugar lactone lactonase YvrE
VSGVAADTPDRIIVAIWGDQKAQRQERPGGSNYLVVVNANGDIVENWSQWDSLFNRPHQVYISPYDPDRHVWVVERGGNGVHEQILKFTNDGSELVMRLLDPQPVQSAQEARANLNPGPLDFGQPAVLAFLPDGHFLLGDGYQNGRIAKYTTDGEFVSQFGSVGSGPGQFDLVHGIAVDRTGRIYVSDRMNHRVQVFTEDGDYIEEWPNIYDPVAIFIDESDAVWVLDATLNRMLKYSLEGQLLDYWGAYARVSSLGRPGWTGGMSLPHQMDMDSDGNLYIAEFSGPWLDKFVPRADADPSRLIGRRQLGAN